MDRIEYDGDSPWYAVHAVAEAAALCPKCGHQVAEHQPSGSHQPRGHALTMVGCLVCGCQITMNAKLKAWGGRRK